MHDNREVTTVVDAVASAIAVIFVALRLYSRHFTQTGYGWDDWLILFVLVPGFVSRFLAIYGEYILILVLARSVINTMRILQRSPSTQLGPRIITARIQIMCLHRRTSCMPSSASSQ